ncbi:MAG: hypothetical protein M3R30_03660 [Candidatus Eremiobacteraeota bacterium]|nr:hypothetical protein [Candidatus Eremiobacteraeota bacterium]
MTDLTLAYVRAFGLRAPGAMLRLATTIEETTPDVLAVCEIDAGDAFALATRFARQWAYRGGQALFWTRAFTASAVHDLYLPFAIQRPFDRRGLLRVDGTSGAAPVALFATQFGGARAFAVPEMRFARTQLNATMARAIAFAQMEIAAPGLGGRGVELLAEDAETGIYAYARGFSATSVERRPYSLIVAVASQGMPPPQ